jgi:hypothetical protein
MKSVVKYFGRMALDGFMFQSLKNTLGCFKNYKSSDLLLAA